MCSNLQASGAGEVVDGTPDSPVDQDPGLEFLIETCDVFMHIPILLSANMHTCHSIIRKSNKQLKKRSKLMCVINYIFHYVFV